MRAHIAQVAFTHLVQKVTRRFPPVTIEMQRGLFLNPA